MGENLKNNFKKYLPYIVGAAAVVIVIILAVSLFTGGPKKAVKNYVKGMHRQKVSKVMKSIDLKGIEAWKYYGDLKEFEEKDYEEFIERYNEVDDEELEDAIKDYEDYIEDVFDDVDDNFKSYKYKLEKIKSVDKLGKDLFVVRAKISLEAKPEDPDDDDIEEIDQASVKEFVVYKNKIVKLPGLY